MKSVYRRNLLKKHSSCTFNSSMSKSFVKASIIPLWVSLYRKQALPNKAQFKKGYMPTGINLESTLHCMHMLYFYSGMPKPRSDQLCLSYAQLSSTNRYTFIRICVSSLLMYHESIVRFSLQLSIVQSIIRATRLLTKRRSHPYLKQPPSLHIKNTFDKDIFGKILKKN